jgi:hypothetical protein
MGIGFYIVVILYLVAVIIMSSGLALWLPLPL